VFDTAHKVIGQLTSSCKQTASVHNRSSIQHNRKPLRSCAAQFVRSRGWVTRLKLKQFSSACLTKQIEVHCWLSGFLLTPKISHTTIVYLLQHYNA